MRKTSMYPCNMVGNNLTLAGSCAVGACAQGSQPIPWVRCMSRLRWPAKERCLVPNIL